MATASSKFTIEDLIVKRLWVEDKRIDSFNLGALVIRDDNYNIGVNTDNPEITLDISGNSGIRIPVGDDSTKPNISEMTGILRYNNDSIKEYYESYIQGSWRPIGGSNLELCTVSGSSKSSILINKKGLTTSNNGGSIEFNLESESGIQSKQAKILAENVSSAGNGSLTFQTAENDSYHDRIFIKSNGDVGIGNASPGKKLHVTGDIQAQDIFTDGGLKNINSIGTFVNLGTNEIYLGVNGTTQLYVSSNNNVGIGTQPSSSYKLHVNGSIAGQQIYSSSLESATINATNKLGIKQNNPQVVLDINDTGAIQLPKGTTTQRDSLPTIRQGMVRYNTTTEQFEGYGAGNAWGSLGGVKDIDQDTFITVSDGTTDTDEIKFFAGNTSTEKMIIKSSGNVGIGTTSPGEKLEIKQGNITITQHNSGYGSEIYGLMFKNGQHNRTLYVAGETYGGGGITDRHLYIGYTEDSTITNSSYTNGAIITVRGDGNVGIGTTSLKAKLDIGFSGETGSLLRLGTDRPWHFTCDATGSSANLNLLSSAAGKNFNIGLDQGVDGGSGTVTHTLLTCHLNTGTASYVRVYDKLGIGTIPNKALHLHHSSDVAIKFSRGTMESHYIRKTGDYLRFYGDDFSTIIFELKNNTNGGNSCNFPSGNVGIGTSSPGSSYKLDVNGNIRVNGNIEVDGNIEANNTIKKHVDYSRLYSSGQSVICVLNTGKLLTAGYGGWYQLFNGSNTTLYTLTDVYTTMTENTSTNKQTAVYDGNNAREVSQGYLTDYVLLSSGAILSGGSNAEGALGANHSSSWEHFERVYPSAEYNGMNAVKLANSSKAYTMGAILNTGQVIMWGKGNQGQIGNNTTTTRNNKPIAPWTSSTHYTGTNAVDIAIGDSHTVLLLNNGQVTCCGRGAEGQLGIGSNSQKNTFQIVNTPNSDYDGTNAIAIAAGFQSTYILLNTGTIVAFGLNNSGQLGINNAINKNKPVNLSHNSGYDGTNAVAIQAGLYHLVVLLNNGKVLTCGYNATGELGTGNNTNMSMLVEPQHMAGYNGGNVKSLLRLSRFTTSVMLDNGQIISCGAHYTATNDSSNRNYFLEVTHTSGYNGKNINYDNFSPLTIKPTNTFFNGGNVAIGSCVAPATLTVGGGSQYHPSNEGVIAIGRSSGSGSHRWINLSIDSNFLFRIGDGGTGEDSTTTNTGFFKCKYDAPDNSFYMNSSGQIGINTGSSMTTTGGTHKLCINNSLALIHDANHLMYIRCNSAGYANFQYYDSGSNSGNIELQPYGGRVYLGNYDNGSDRVYIKGGANIRQKDSWSSSHISYSTHGDWYIRTGTTSGKIRLCDYPTSQVYIGDTGDSSDLLCYGYVACGLHNDSGAGTAKEGNKTLWISSRNKNGFNYGWWIGAQKETPSTSDNDLHFTVCRGNSTGHDAAYIQDSASSVRMNFTGQHRTHVKEIPHTKIESYIGLIVCANNNEYISMTYTEKKKSIQRVCKGKKAIEISESLPIVSLSIKEKDKSCFGVISNVEDEDIRTDGGNFTSVYTKELGDTRTFINSLGEGAIWVTNINGNLESGDYITTSKLPGYGQKQNEEYLANYTVAKITMDCDFNPPVQKIYKIKKHEKEVVYYRSEIQIPPDEEIEEIPGKPEKDKKEIFYENHKFHIMDISKNILWLELDENTYLKEKDIKIYRDYDFNKITKKEMINVLDENNEFAWEETDEYETAYHLRYLTEDGTIINRGVYESKKINGEKVYIAAFVGCTYHCG
tara:strand:- start:1698 stop:6923 length:5226 start_codon:yes stop_codon:yes gene_type:complete